MKTENAMIFVSRPNLMLERVGGLSVIERQLATAARAGLTKVWINRRLPDDASASSVKVPAGLQVVWSSRDTDDLDCRPPYLVLSGDHFIRVETLRYVVEAGYAEPATLEDGAGVSVIQAVPYRTEKFVQPEKQALPLGASVYLDLPADPGPVLSWLMSTAVKATDGFMARHFDRHVSLAVSRLLLDTWVSPNMMTVVSLSFGFAGAACFLEPGLALPGAALILLHSVLDGCDGELSRMRFQESRLGAALDFWGDNLVHVALWSCLALGFARADRSGLPLVPGLAAVIGTLGSAALAYRAKSARRDNRIAGGDSRLASVADSLAQRDFIYALVVIAYFGWTYPFLWAAGIGSVVFFVAMIYLGRDQNEQANQPHPAR